MREDNEPLYTYLNKFDKKGQAIPHERHSEDLPKFLERAIKGCVIDEFEHSGLPRDELERQELFSWLKRQKRNRDITSRAIIGQMVVNAGAIGFYLIKLIGK